VIRAVPAAGLRRKDGVEEMNAANTTRQQTTHEENRKSRILIIEDNEQNLYLITFILQQHGHEVFQARDGREGIRLATQLEPDLILLDIQLPEIDGYAVARELRSNPQLDNVPIVAVTSYAMLGDRERILAEGCTGYIEKPINPETFLTQIFESMRDPRGAASQSTTHNGQVHAASEAGDDQDTDR